MKVFTAFSGYDSQCMALERAGIDYELVGWSEINVASIVAHDLCFPEAGGKNCGDISKIDWSTVPDFDLFTYSSPCQDFSLAGLQRGGDKGSGTRSSLLWKCEKAIEAKKPSYLVMENVKAIKGAQFAENLKKWKDTLIGLGYFNYEYVLNASDYNIPQNRERYFLVSIRSDKFRMMGTPMTQPMTTTLRDVIEEEVDSKYYFDLSKRKVEDIIAKIGMETTAYLGNGQYFTNTCRGGVNRAPNTCYSKSGFTDIIAPTLCSQYCDSAYSHIILYENGHRAPGIIEDTTAGYVVRKLTERECLRLMDVDDKYIERLMSHRLSRTNLYEMAGNSIPVGMLAALFESFLK